MLTEQQLRNNYLHKLCNRILLFNHTSMGERILEDIFLKSILKAFPIDIIRELNDLLLLSHTERKAVNPLFEKVFVMQGQHEDLDMSYLKNSIIPLMKWIQLIEKHNNWTYVLGVDEVHNRLCLSKLTRVNGDEIQYWHTPGCDMIKLVTCLAYQLNNSPYRECKHVMSLQFLFHRFTGICTTPINKCDLVYQTNNTYKLITPISTVVFKLDTIDI